MRARNVLTRIGALALVTAMLSTEALAVVKNVNVWGAKSINDAGRSDYRIDMDKLIDNQSGFLQTDGLTEYFHVDEDPVPKTDMTEALSWLIDNNIISRDEQITVSNVGGIPDTFIDKKDFSEARYTSVNRSDAVMYIYKSVFGPIDGRTIAVEAPNVRSDGGVERTLADMYRRHTGRVFQEIYGQSVATPGGDGAGNNGGAGGDASVETHYENDAKAWTYTPQGDKYTSIFGDTNIFISENHFDQIANGGDGGGGGAGGHGVTGGSFNSGVGGEGGGGGGGGSAQNIINYETDYKQIYLVPGADLLFYNTSDVVEVYLQALQSKGILPSDLAPSTQKYKDTFLPLTADGAAYAAWSGSADPYVVNMSANQRVRIQKVSYANLRDMLGANYTVRFSGNRLTIDRQNLFDSNTGYFEDERVTKMEVLEYMYWMLYANEKKLTGLEVDIVNFKYGLELSGLANTDDIEVVKYLIAKGILNYDGSSELDNLYGQMTWDEFVTILYRVANPNARLDFSQIQLTDSEQSWKARGFSPQTIQLTSESVPSVWVDRGVKEEDIVETTPYDDPDDNNGEVTVNALSFSDVVTELLRAPVQVEAKEWQPAGSEIVMSDGWKPYQAMYDSFYFDTTVCGGVDDPVELLREYVNRAIGMTREQTLADHLTNHNSGNPIHSLHRMWASNFWFVLICAQAYGYEDMFVEVFDEGIATATAERDKYPTSDNAYVWKDAIVAQLCGAKETLVDNIEYFRTDVAPNVQYWGFPREEGGLPTDMLAPGTFSGIYGWYGNFGGIYAIDAMGIRIIFGDKFRDTVLDNENPNRTSITLAKVYTATELAAMNSYQTADGVTLGGIEAAQADFMSHAKLFTDRTSTNKQGILTYTDQKVQYVTLQELEKSGIAITRVGDTPWILQGPTGVRAVFMNGDENGMATAIVGTMVVSTTVSTGVAYKDEHGDVQYHLDAIRALISATDDVTLGTNHVMGMPDVDFSKMLKEYPIISASGVQNGSVTAIKALVARNVNSPPKGINIESEIWKNMGTVVLSAGGQSRQTKWGTFLAINESSNLMNYAVRRIEYTPTNSSIKQVGFLVLTFEPDETLKDAAATVYGGTMLQDILDAANKRPEDSTAAKVWEQNRQLANLCANVIYNTSDKTYVQTGWLKPTMTFYTCGTTREATIPASVFAPIVPSEHPGLVRTITMVEQTDGAVVAVADSETTMSSAMASTSASYWISSDSRVLITGDRVYMNLWAIPTLTVGRRPNGEFVFMQKAAMANPSSFTVGSVITMKNDKQNTQILVTETTDTGRVICQVGPVQGYPMLFDGTAKLVNPASKNIKFSLTKGATNYVGMGAGTVDLLYGRFYSLFGGKTAYAGVEWKGVTSDPVPYRASNGQGNYLVFNGKKIQEYSSAGKPVGNTKAATTMTPANSPQDLINSYPTGSGRRTVDWKNTNAYFTIEFDATKFTVQSGYLTPGSASATDFLSPDMFTSLNNVIIDGMISKATGAIPINEVPDGSLLEMANSYYAAQGTSAAEKTFVGYTPITGQVQTATLQTVALAYAAENIRAGNQMMNISHFFSEFKILDPKDSGQQDTYGGSLKVVADNSLGLDGNTKCVAINQNGAATTIVNPSATAVSRYGAVAIKFQDYLLAYQVGTTDSGVAKYALLSHAVSNTDESPAADGPFADIPFFENSVIDRGIAERTSDVLASGYQENPLAASLREQLQLEFEKLFAGDLITLARFLLFLVLIWLVVASWLCYACRASNLLPILDAIKHPSGNQQQQGLDLMKLVSLGTISLETDFTLGRFLQYNAILAVLLCVVMLTGRITL